MSVGVGNYQSNEAILAFVALQQGRMYGELEESMTHAELRGQMASDLNDIKLHLEQANRTADFSQVDAELQSFLADYGQVPEFAEITDTVKEISVAVGEKQATLVAARDLGSAAFQTEDPVLAQRLLEQADGAGPSSSEPEPPSEADVALALAIQGANGFPKETLQGWLQAISEKLDASGTSDQLTMIHIKQLNDNINQSSSLASELISSRNSTLSAVINNIA